MDVILRSNRGSEFITFDFFSRHDCGPEQGFDCAVAIQSSSWNDGEPKPVRADLGSRHLSLIELALLNDSIAKWLALPLDKLATNPLKSRHSLDFTGENSLSLEFGPRADTIDSGKPVVTIAWRLSSFHGEIHFVTDPSCLQNFIDSLRATVLKKENTV
jgi:hypothetical protein